jgi:GxxExxY protein
MNSKFQRANAWSKVVIGAAIEVHTLKGAGLIESIYERCILREFELREVPVLSQLDVEIEYKGPVFSEPLTLDLYVDDCLLLELKAIQTVLPIQTGCCVLDPKATIMGLQLAVLRGAPLFCLAGQASHSSVRFSFPSFANFASFF